MTRVAQLATVVKVVNSDKGHKSDEGSDGCWVDGGNDGNDPDYTGG